MPELAEDVRGFKDRSYAHVPRSPFIHKFHLYLDLVEVSFYEQISRENKIVYPKDNSSVLPVLLHDFGICSRPRPFSGNCERVVFEFLFFCCENLPRIPC